MAEDNFNGKAYNGLFAVFDGHSGDRAADFCEKNISQMIIRNANQIERGDTLQAIKQGKKISS